MDLRLNLRPIEVRTLHVAINLGGIIICFGQIIQHKQEPVYTLSVD